MGVDGSSSFGFRSMAELAPFVTLSATQIGKLFGNNEVEEKSKQGVSKLPGIDIASQKSYRVLKLGAGEESSDPHKVFRNGRLVQLKDPIYYIPPTDDRGVVTPAAGPLVAVAPHPTQRRRATLANPGGWDAGGLLQWRPDWGSAHRERMFTDWGRAHQERMGTRAPPPPPPEPVRQVDVTPLPPKARVTVAPAAPPQPPPGGSATPDNCTRNALLVGLSVLAFNVL
jgi:hypothetical protein